MSQPVAPNPAIFQQIGDTPLVPVPIEGGRRIWAKLEFFNPSGSVKDRIARNILQSAWRRGEIDAQSVVVEASSGSTSIALALACSHMGLEFFAVLPEGASKERQWTITAYGGRIETVPKDAGMEGARARARELAQETRGFYTDQFQNEDNSLAHDDTAQEILRDIPGRHVTAFVSGVGTGGTLAGVYRYLTEHHYEVRPVVARLKPGARTLHDIGFTPPGFECLYERLIRSDARFRELVEEVEVEEHVAIQWTERLWRLGFPVGPASGVNFAAAFHVAMSLPEDANVATVFTDRMERYFSTDLFDEIKAENERQLEKRRRADLKNEIKREVMTEVARMIDAKLRLGDAAGEALT